jgi:hypothetical protein
VGYSKANKKGYENFTGFAYECSDLIISGAFFFKYNISYVGIAYH